MTTTMERNSSKLGYSIHGNTEITLNDDQLDRNIIHLNMNTEERVRVQANLLGDRIEAREAGDWEGSITVLDTQGDLTNALFQRLNHDHTEQVTWLDFRTHTTHQTSTY